MEPGSSRRRPNLAITSRCGSRTAGGAPCLVALMCWEVPRHRCRGPAIRLTAARPGLAEGAPTRAEFARRAEDAVPRWFQARAIIQARSDQKRERRWADRQHRTRTAEQRIRGRRFAGAESPRVATAASGLDIDPNCATDGRDLIDRSPGDRKRRQPSLPAHPARLSSASDTAPSRTQSGPSVTRHLSWIGRLVGRSRV